MFGFFVGPLGLEPRLFWTKTRRVASYTMGQYLNADANLIQSLFHTNFFNFFSEKNHLFQLLNPPPPHFQLLLK